MLARAYQSDAVAAILKAFEQYQSTLLVMATGLGKGNVAGYVAQHFVPGRVLFLAHRKELVHQGADRLQALTGYPVDIEMADDWAGNSATIVSASLDSITRRLQRWKPDHFDLIIFDEFQHAPAPSYRAVWDHFTGKKLGMTATPDRGDAKALGKVCESVAYVRDIVDGIEDGYLVPIKGKTIRIESIDLSHVSKSGGDLAAGELDDEMLQHVEGIVSKTLEFASDKRGIWFFPGVQSAELAAERINALGYSCGFVCGETPKDERDTLFRQFRRGELQHLCNCQLITEGTDLPLAEMIVLGRPTLSRSLYAQMIGRGLRVLPGTVDGVETSEERRALVAASAKPFALVIDFAGNAGRHTLITPQDILGGDYSDEEEEEANEEEDAAEVEVDGLEDLEAARVEMMAMMRGIESKVAATVKDFDPFRVLGIREPAAGVQKDPITIPQMQELSRYNMTGNKMRGLSRVEAQELITSLKTRRDLGLATMAQLTTLQRYGVTETNIPFTKASKAINYLAKSNWSPEPGALERLLA